MKSLLRKCDLTFAQARMSDLTSNDNVGTHGSVYTSGFAAFYEWNYRADVACVGADLRVRPQNRLRSGEDGRTHRSAPTKGYSLRFPFAGN